MNAHEAAPVPPEFLRLWEFGQQTINPPRRQQSTGLYVLPVPLRRSAEIVEGSAIYQHFVGAALFAPMPSPWRMREALRRSGFYQEVQGSGQPAKVWRVLQDRLQTHVTHLRTLVLLDGCWFPHERFSIGGVTIQRLTADELRELGPGAEIAPAFFPTEALDPSWYAKVWFLVKPGEREIKPTSFYIRFGYDTLKQFWEPILALSLYKTDYFGLPIVLESDRGWRLEQVRWSEPMSNTVEDSDGEVIEIPRTDYDVDTKEMLRFDAFRSFFDGAIDAARQFKTFRLAGRRYLRAIQMAGHHVSSDDEYEDALLQHIFALEALLSAGEREAIGDKLATRAAWLIGTSDRVRNEVFKMVKALYGARSKVVHGVDAEAQRRRSQALEEVRDLLRRILVALMALRRATATNGECLNLLKSAAYDQGSQAEIKRAIQPVWGLIDPAFEWPQMVWGPRVRPSRIHRLSGGCARHDRSRIEGTVRPVTRCYPGRDLCSEISQLPM